MDTKRTTSTRYQVLFASLIGSTIELFDFYIYATAAVLVFPILFFPKSDPAGASLASLATFGIAFLARPIGSVIFGHYGDRLGRKRTLVSALATMGISTVAIGALPTYHSIGLLAPALLVCCRIGQGIGLGGEWGGAMLLAVENAPAHKRAWYGMFPQLGAPLGLFFSSGVFLLISRLLTKEHFLQFGWRLPFLSSAVLVLLGLYVRSQIAETPVFQDAAQRGQRVRMPALVVFRSHYRALCSGVLLCLATFVLFYLMTVFALLWGTTELHYSREEFLRTQLFGNLFFAAMIPVSAALAERGRRRMFFLVTVSIGGFGLSMAPLFVAGPAGMRIMLFLGFSLLGLTYGPLGTIVSELFPTNIRYTGSSLVFSLAAILGASAAPYVTTWLSTAHGLPYVGYYLSASTALTLLGIYLIRETKNDDFTGSVAEQPSRAA
ncbi:MAG: MFS transporter [Bryobacteraceae bacterium]